MGDEAVARIGAKLEALEGRVARMQEMQAKHDAKIDELNIKFVQISERISVGIWVLTGVYTLLQGIPGILSKFGIGG